MHYTPPIAATVPVKRIALGRYRATPQISAKRTLWNSRSLSLKPLERGERRAHGMPMEGRCYGRHTERRR